MEHPGDSSKQVPVAHPDVACNTGYAEPKPRTKEQARIPGGKQPPNAEEGGLEHDPDPST